MLPPGDLRGTRPQGLYAKARKGVIPEFTGISDPYEEPEHPETRVDTTGLNPMEAAQEIYLYLLREVCVSNVQHE